MRRIAITGGAAEGKSTVLAHLRELGYKTASADEVAREVFSDPDMQSQIALLVGVQAPARPDQVRQAMLEHPALRRELNRLTHPEIRRRLLSGTATFFEVPLLIETAMHGDFQEVWLVSCGAQEQLRRLELRLNSEQARQVVASQLPSSAKEPFADRIIRTNKGESFVFEEVRALASIVVCE